jgi:hypothetical protein
MMTNSDSSNAASDVGDAPSLALADLRSLLDRLTAFRRQFGSENPEYLLEAFTALEQGPLATSGAYSSAAATIILMGVQTGRTPPALCAVAVRAVEAAAINAHYASDVGATEWRQTIQRVASMARPSLPEQWRDLLDETPSELAIPPVPLRNVGRHGLVISSAAASLDRAIAHFSIAAGAVRSFVPRRAETDDELPAANADLSRAFHAIISGNRALARTFVQVSSFLSTVRHDPTGFTRSEEEMPDPNVWLRAAWRIGVGQRLPAAIAATMAFRLAGMAPPSWVNQLAGARQTASEPEFDRAFNSTVSYKFLKTIPRPPDPEPRPAPQAHIQATKAQHGRPEGREPFKNRPPARYEPPNSAIDTSAALARVARNPFLAKTTDGIT